MTDVRYDFYCKFFFAQVIFTRKSIFFCLNLLNITIGFLR